MKGRLNSLVFDASAEAGAALQWTLTVITACDVTLTLTRLNVTTQESKVGMAHVSTAQR